MYIYIYKCIYTFIYIYTYLCIWVDLRRKLLLVLGCVDLEEMQRAARLRDVPAGGFLYLCINIYIYIYTYTYIHIYTYM